MTRRNVLLQALASTPDDLRWMTHWVDEMAQSRRPAPERWSVSDVVSHLIYAEERFQLRLRRICVEDSPVLSNILPDETAHDLSAPLADLIQQFQHLRGQTLAFLAQLPAGDWQRPAIFEDDQRTSLRYCVQGMVDHDIARLNQIVEIQRELQMLPPLKPQPQIPEPPAEPSPSETE